MSLITRIGASYANSFVTLDQADQILPVVLPDDVSAWTALTTAQKEYRLILAAQVMALLPFRGQRTYKNQALCFPRVRWDTEEGCWSDELDYDADQHRAFRIPEEVKEAQCMIALSVVHRGLANRPGVTDAAESPITSVSISGALSVSYGKGETFGTLLDQAMSSAQSLIYFKLREFLSQFRGGAFSRVTDDDHYHPLTALTSTTTSTSTTSSSTTTTTVP